MTHSEAVSGPVEGTRITEGVCPHARSSSRPAGALSATAPPRSAAKPNIVFILVDNLGYVERNTPRHESKWAWRET